MPGWGGAGSGERGAGSRHAACARPQAPRLCLASPRLTVSLPSDLREIALVGETVTETQRARWGAGQGETRLKKSQGGCVPPEPAQGTQALETPHS